MSLEMVLDQVLWSNDGTANISGLASGSPIYPLMTDSLGSGTLAAASTSSWKQVTLNGVVDRLFVQLRTLVVAAGGITSLTAGSQNSTSIVAVADLRPSIPGASPWAMPGITAAPSSVISTTTKNQYSSNVMNVIPWDQSIVGWHPATSDLVHVNSGGILAPNGASAPTGYWGWTAELTRRVGVGTSAVTQMQLGLPSVSGIYSVAVAVGFFQTIAGTLATTKLQTEIRLIGFREITDVRDGQKNLRNRLNIAATT